MMFGHTWCTAPRDNRALKIPEAHVMLRANVLLQRCKVKFIQYVFVSEILLICTVQHFTGHYTVAVETHYSGRV